MSMLPLSSADMFRPPVNRAMRVLDRSFFKKRITLCAARVFDKKQISKFRFELSHDILKLERMQSVQSIPDLLGEDYRALLLNPRIKTHGRSCRFLP